MCVPQPSWKPLGNTWGRKREMRNRRGRSRWTRRRMRRRRRLLGGFLGASWGPPGGLLEASWAL